MPFARSSLTQIKLLFAALLILIQPLYAAWRDQQPPPTSSRQQQSAYEEFANRLLAADDNGKRQMLLSEESALVSAELSRALNSLGVARYLSRPSDAVFINRAFQLAHEIARQVNDSRGSAEALNNLCLAKHQQGAYEEALGYCNQAYQLFSSIDDKLGLARAFDRLGMVNASLGSYATAKTNFEDGLKIREELGDPDRTAKTMNEFALFHMRLGYYEQAVTLFQQALKLRDEIAQKSPGNKENQISKHYLLANLGLAYEHQGFYTLALGEYEKSRAIATTLKLDPELISGDIGSTYKKQGNFALALRYFSESLAARERAGSRPQIISALINLGEIHQMTGDGEKSIELYKRALELSERETNKRLICSSHRSLGTGFFNQKMYDQALIEFEKTLAICDPGFNREETADVTVQIAAVYALRRDLARATALADNAYEIVSRIESPGLRSQVLATVGRIYLMANQIEKAKKALLESISATEQMRGNVAGNEAQRQAFFENKTAPYLTFVELLLAQNQPAEALTYVEAAKARVLLDVTQSGKVSLSKALSSAEQEEEKYLNNELVSLNIQIYREQLRPQPDQAKQAELMKQREKVRLRYEDFRTKLYVVHPELKVRRGEAKTLTLDEAKELLPDNQTALLNYVVTPARAQVFVLTKAKDGGAKLRVYPLAINRETLTTQVEQFRGQLAGRDARFGKLARDLYSLLLKKAQAELPPQTKLIIVPDGPLWELPFQALLTTQGRFLWEDHIIAYAPSLTVLREMTKAARDKGNKRGTQSLFAIGDPALGREAIERAKSLMGGETLSQLPEARTQVETLRKFYDANRSKVFTGEAAAEATVKSQAGKFDILHFATHSVLNDRNPLYSYILLAQTDAAQASAPSKESPKEDGLLEAWEIMQMDLHADLAVLSACETARGRVGAGEGMIGLTWALFVAGVPTTVVSQWKVSADSTADLMVEFHRQLQLRNAGSLPRPASEWTKAEALRLAALKLLRGGQSRHPFYWAGFVLIGQPR